MNLLLSLRNASVLAGIALLVSGPLLLTSAEGNTVADPVELPFIADFEADEGYTPGPIDSDPWWNFEPGLLREILNFGAVGDQSLGLTGWNSLLLTINGPSEPTVSWVDFFIKPVFAAEGALPLEILSEQAAVTGFVKVGGEGEIYAMDGDGFGGGEWLPSGSIHPLDENASESWIRLSYRLDYWTRLWDLYVDGKLMMADLGFLDNSVDRLGKFSMRSGSPTSLAALDYFYAGTENPLFQDTSGDGLPDDWLLAHGLDPAVYQRYDDPQGVGLTNLERYMMGSFPMEPFDPDTLSGLSFFETFETHPVGALTSWNNWRRPFGEAFVTRDALPSGAAALQVESGAHVFNPLDGASHEVVWFDAVINPTPTYPAPEIPSNVTVAYYFNPQGDIVAFDGLGDGSGIWETFSAGQPGDWRRVTVRADYGSQTFDLYVDNIRIALGLGFAYTQPHLTRLDIREETVVDRVALMLEEPPELDNDGDGLTNAEERLLGSDTDNPDTSGDGMWDGNKVLWGFDPTVAQNFARLVENEEGEWEWSTGFETDEGFWPGLLNGQQGWLASVGAEISTESVLAGEQGVRIPTVDLESEPHQIERFMGFGNESQVWVTMHVQGQPGSLPDPESVEGHNAALAAFNFSGFLFAYDGEQRKWRNTGERFDAGEWVRLDILLDYTESRWLLCVNGVLVLKDLGFRDSGLRTLTRIAVRGAAGAATGPSGVDELRASLNEPANLDFSGDGMTNDEKRALGLDIFATDTTGDGLPDWWLVQHGLDALDPSIGSMDLTGDGLTVFQEYILGTDPTKFDTDGDGWSDFKEYLAGTNPEDASDYPDADGMAGWSLAGIGPGMEPYAFRVGEEYRLLGSGRGTLDHNDGLTYVYQEISGNFEVTARVGRSEYLELRPSGQSRQWAQNGLMIRSALDEGASHTSIFATRDEFQSGFREVSSWLTITLPHGSVYPDEAKYFRIRRIGNSFRHYSSEDGQVWQIHLDTTIAMPETILVGMFASARTNSYWIRSRVTDVNVRQIEDDAKWTDDQNTSTFDSFSWFGEWDGEGDFDALELLSRRPSLEELHQIGFEIPVAIELGGAEAVQTKGDWRTRDGSIVCMGRRGWVEFDLEVAAPDVFLLELEGREHKGDQLALATFDLKFYLGEEYLGTRRLEARSGEPGTVQVFTPWLEPGTHRLRVLWDGPRRWGFLKVDSVRLRTIDSTNTTGDGLKQWVEDRIRRQSGTFPQPPLMTYVSPLQVEGRDRFNTLMRLENQPLLEGDPGMHRQFYRPLADHPRGEIGRDFKAFRDGLSAGEPPVSVPDEAHLIPRHPDAWTNYLSAWSVPARSGTRRGAGYRFWSDVPLAPFVDNAITLQWQNGAAEERRVVRWIPYNVLMGGNLVLRAGDSMILTAHNGNQQSGGVSLKVNQDSFETVPASPLVYTFLEPGNYVIQGTYRHSNGTEVSGTLEVTVQDFAFGDRPAAYVERRRSWDPLQGAESNVVFEGDPRLHLAPVVDVDTATLRSTNNVRNVVTARSSGGGPILDAVEVESFRLFSSWETYVQAVDVLSDGSKLVETMVILSPVPDDIRVKLKIFVGGVLFDDGTLERWLGPEDFDELGQTIVRFIMSQDAITSNCHRTYVYQNETLIGVR